MSSCLVPHLHFLHHWPIIPYVYRKIISLNSQLILDVLILQHISRCLLSWRQDGNTHIPRKMTSLGCKEVRPFHHVLCLLLIRLQIGLTFSDISRQAIFPTEVHLEHDVGYISRVRKPSPLVSGKVLRHLKAAREKGTRKVH